MARRKTLLSTTPPCGVERALRRLGANLRAARLRRNLTIQEAATQIGAGARVVADAERGRPGTAAAVYLALLATYDFLSQMEGVGALERDVVPRL